MRRINSWVYIVAVMWDPNALKIYVDGSCMNNPGTGGIAGIVEFPDNHDRLNEIIFQTGFENTTNNRMEVKACIEALRYAVSAARSLSVRRVMIISDSQYVCDGQNLILRWRLQKWRTKDGRPVENSDLWKIFISERQKIRVSLQVEWEAGKTRPVLKEVDKLAKLAAKNPSELDFGYSGGQVHRSLVRERSAASLFPARGQECIVRVYRKEQIRGEYKISFDLIESNLSAGKYCAYADEAYALHRSHRYRVRFNSNEKYPRMESFEELTDFEN